MNDDDTLPSERPPEKPTTRFEAPPKWAEGMFARVHEAINASEARTETKLDEQGIKLDACISGLKTVNGELEEVKADFHEFKGATNARLESNSMRAKQESVHDQEQDERLAELSESQMAKLIAAAAKTPKGQKVVNALVLFVLAALGLGTIWLTAHMHAMQQQQPVMIQENKK